MNEMYEDKTAARTRVEIERVWRGVPRGFFSDLFKPMSVADEFGGIFGPTMLDSQVSNLSFQAYLVLSRAGLADRDPRRDEMYELWEAGKARPKLERRHIKFRRYPRYGEAL